VLLLQLKTTSVNDVKRSTKTNYFTLHIGSTYITSHCRWLRCCGGTSFRRQLSCATRCSWCYGRRWTRCHFCTSSTTPPCSTSGGGSWPSYLADYVSTPRYTLGINADNYLRNDQ